MSGHAQDDPETSGYWVGDWNSCMPGDEPDPLPEPPEIAMLAAHYKLAEQRMADLREVAWAMELSSDDEGETTPKQRAALLNVLRAQADDAREAWRAFAALWVKA